jgi:hypothetical protein
VSYCQDMDLERSRQGESEATDVFEIAEFGFLRSLYWKFGRAPFWGSIGNFRIRTKNYLFRFGVSATSFQFAVAC